MGMHERWSGEYEYDIEVLPLVPPMSNGNGHEAKVARPVRRQRSSRADLLARCRSACGGQAEDVGDSNRRLRRKKEAGFLDPASRQ